MTPREGARDGQSGGLLALGRRSLLEANDDHTDACRNRAGKRGWVHRGLPVHVLGTSHTKSRISQLPAECKVPVKLDGCAGPPSTIFGVHAPPNFARLPPR